MVTCGKQCNKAAEPWAVAGPSIRNQHFAFFLLGSGTMDGALLGGLTRLAGTRWWLEGNRRRLEGNRRRLEGNRRRLEGNREHSILSV